MTRLRLHAVETQERSPDAELLARVAKGDLSALGTLYDSFAPSVLRFADRVGGHHDAEDIVQTVFVRVVHAAGSFDPRASSARPWLFGIATRVVLERRRSLRRFVEAVRTLAAHDVRTTENPAEARTDIQRALTRLTPAKRAVLVLAEAEGFTCDEIAAMLELPVGTVWTRLHHARRELRRFHERQK